MSRTREGMAIATITCTPTGMISWGTTKSPPPLRS
jgi:hypothetical protein